MITDTLAERFPGLEQHEGIGAGEASVVALKASVVIVNYNGGQDLLRCLHSLAASQGCHETILVDNGSSDGSLEAAERAFPWVKVIRNGDNLGFGHGCNLGAWHATGEYLIFLNPDTVVSPGWEEALIRALQADPTAGLATSRILLLSDPEMVNTCGNDLHFTGLALCRGMATPRQLWDEPAEVSAISGAAFAVRRELFNSLGGFDEAFFLYMEDTDLSWRARLAGYRCLYVPDSVVYHDYALRFGHRKSFYQERNRYLMLLKGMRWRSLAALTPALLVAEAVTWGFVLLREPGRLANKLAAYGWVLSHRSQIQAARRQTQALRRVGDRDLIARCTHRLDLDQTGRGIVATAAGALFNPLFFALHKLALALVRW